MKKILIIIPAYNEEKSILKTYTEIINYNKKHKTNYECIVINDGSKDNTRLVLEENNIPHINLPVNLGIGGAVQTGYKYAFENDYDIAIQFDGDGQHDVNYIKNIIKPIENKKANLVIGSRFIKEELGEFKSTKMRRVGINVISKIIKRKTKKKIYDTTSGFRAADKNVINIFKDEYPTEYPEPISTVNVLLKGFETDEVPVEMKPRTEGKSSISKFKSIYYMINVILSILIMKGKRK
jgi:glycosyltransferase involved in cell wall biosynthesis